MLPSDIIKRYRVSDGRGFRLAEIDPTDRCGLDIEKAEAKTLLAEGAKRLASLQERLYAEHRWAILIILQALDAAGKDSVIKHVMSGVNPQGCDVHPFKAPSQIELDHDFLWRAAVVLPRRGHIGIFNRSYYEEVLVVRVHKELLERQSLPPKLVTNTIWQQRFEDINAFELHLARNGIVPIKFFLHVSKQEQQKRLLERIDDPAKQWKFNAADVGESKLWDQYMQAYDDMIRGTATEDAPWYVVPADHKWFTRLVVAEAIVEQLEKIDPKFPTLDAAALRDLEAVRAALLAEGSR
ncbi:MAG TPA: polyphosphate kinase 2 family protein [Methyloceanibacter sp.]|jgi:PPK2 family polyphosphate:nucleotide phosphotransferase|nr:polyphosphate kinase 2 family protein [Methyloceanibacter sp.]